MKDVRRMIAACVLSASLLHAGTANALTPWFIQSKGQATFEGEIFSFYCYLMEISNNAHLVFSAMFVECVHSDIWYWHASGLRGGELSPLVTDFYGWGDTIPYSCPNGVFGDSWASVFWLTGGQTNGYMSGSTFHDCPGGGGWEN